MLPTPFSFRVLFWDAAYSDIFSKLFGFFSFFFCFVILVPGCSRAAALPPVGYKRYLSPPSCNAPARPPAAGR